MPPKPEVKKAEPAGDWYSVGLKGLPTMLLGPAKSPDEAWDMYREKLGIVNSDHTPTITPSDPPDDSPPPPDANI